MIKLEIPEQTPLLNKWQRYHWRERKRIIERFAWLLRQSIKEKPKTPIKKCIVEIDRHCSGVQPDWDGLYGGLKPILDCLVVCTKTNPHGLGFIEDDAPWCIARLTATPIKCKRSEHKTVIRIIPMIE